MFFESFIDVLIANEAGYQVFFRSSYKTVGLGLVTNIGPTWMLRTVYDYLVAMSVSVGNKSSPLIKHILVHSKLRALREFVQTGCSQPTNQSDLY